MTGEKKGEKTPGISEFLGCALLLISKLILLYINSSSSSSPGAMIITKSIYAFISSQFPEKKETWFIPLILRFTQIPKFFLGFQSWIFSLSFDVQNSPSAHFFYPLEFPQKIPFNEEEEFSNQYSKKKGTPKEVSRDPIPS